MTTPHLTGVGDGSPEWETPQALFDLLNRRHRFDYDPFASTLNHKTPFFSSLGGTFLRSGPDAGAGGAGRVQYSSATGIEYPWAGRRVFANPPYSRGLIDRCIDRAIEQAPATEVTVLLVPAATSSGWFQRLIPHGTAVFLPKRVAFVHPPFACKESCTHELGVPIKSPPVGMMVFTFGVTESQWLEALTR